MSTITTQAKQLIIIDSHVTDWQSLVGNVNPDTAILVLDPARDGINQIAELVANYSNLDAIHIISHGSTGSLSLGSGTLNNYNIVSYASQLVSIGSMLNTGGDILLYGCNVAQGVSGLAFINTLRQFTGADIAASANLKGDKAQGGDWVLEQQIGVVEAYLPISPAVIANYQHTLNVPPTINVSTTVFNTTDKLTATPFSSVLIVDADLPAQILDITITLDSALKGSLFSPVGGIYNPATGVYTFSGTAAQAQAAVQALIFTPTANRVAPTTIETTNFSIIVDDGFGAAATNNSIVVKTTSINDAPVLSGAVASQTINDNNTLSPFGTFSIKDADSVNGQLSPQQLTVTVTLDNASNGLLTSNIGVGNYDSSTGVYTITGTATQTQTALRNLVFHPAANRVDVGTTQATTFTVRANDGFATTTDNTTTVVSTSINDAPALGGAGVGQAVNDNSALSPFASFTITDPDINQIQTVTITLDDATKGVLTNLSGGTFVGGVYSFSGTAAAAQAALRNLIFIPTANHIAVDTTETTTFAVSVTDSGGLSASNSLTTVVSKSINDAPVLGNAVAGQPVTDTASVSPFATFTISDPDVGQTQTVTVALDDFAKGVLTNLGGGTYNAGTGVYSFTGTAAAAQTAIQGLTFTPTPNHVTVGSTETTTFTVTVNDGAPSSPSVTNSATSVITTSVNDAPVLGGITAVTNVADNTTVGVTPFASVTITDPDSPAQTQTVKVTLDATAKGVLSNLGAGTYDSSTGVYTFKGTATDAQAAIRGLIVTPNANRVAVGATETTTFTITVNDGVAAIVTNNATTVVSSSINDAPTLGGAVPGQTVDDNATLSPFAAFTVTDPDSTQTQTLTVTLDDATKGSLSNLAGGTFVAGTYSFTGTAAQAQTAIRGLIFTPTPNHVAVGSTETTTFTVNVTDSFPASATDATTTVIAKSINDAPVLANITPVTNILDTAVAHPFSTVTISDADAAQSQTVTITLDNAAKGQLSTLGGGSYDIATGVYQFTGTAAAAQAAVQGLTFTPTANHVAVGTTETTSFTISVFDGVAPAVTNNATTVVSTSVNEPPTISGIAVAPISINDTGTTSPFQTVVIADPDSTQSQTVTVSFTAANGSLSNLGGGTVVGGVYSFNGTAAAAQAAVRGLVFTPTANQVAVGTAQTTAFTLSVNDGSGAVTDNTTTVLATSVNDAPTVGGVTAVTTITDKVTATPFSHFTINDVDFGPQDQFVTVTLDNAAKGTLSSTLGAPVGTYNAATGVYTLSAIGISAAVAQTEIQSLVFTPAQNRVPVGTTETTTFTVSVNDGVVVTPTTNSATTVVSSSVNDAPVLGGGVAGQTVNDTATLSPFTAFTLTDADNPAQTQTVTVTLDNAAKGALSSSTSVGSYNAATGVYNFTGTASAAQAAIQSLVFTPAANRVAVNATETTTFTVKANDGFVTTTDSTTTVISTSMNDAPVLGGAGVGQTVNDNATLSPFASFTVSDADGNQTQNVTITLDDPTKGTLTNLGSGSFVAGVYSFTGTAAQAQTAIRGLIFHPAANRVAVDTTETTTFAVSVTDSGGLSASNSLTTVVSKSINDAPVLGNAVAGQPVTDTASVSPFATFTISDPDVGQTQTVTVALDDFAKGVLTNLGGGTYNAGTGVYSFTGTAAAAQTAIQGLTFTPTPNHVTVGSTEITTFTVTVNDGAPSSPSVTNSATSVITTSVNDAPVLGGITAVTNVADNTTVGVTPFASVTITDPDSPAQTQTVKVTLDATAKGVLSNLGAGTYDSSTGVYTFKGTATDAQAAIRGLIVTPNANRVAVGATETTTFTITVNDGVAAIVTNNATTVVSSSINDAPTLGGAVPGQTVDDNAILSPFAAFTVTDPDSTQTQTLTVTLDDATKGSLSNLAGGTFVAGTYSFTGTAAQAQTAIRGLIFTPTPNHVAVGSTETTTFTVNVTDSFPASATDATTTVIAKSINDAPVLANITPVTNILDTAVAHPFSTVTISDADAAQSQTVTITLDNAAKGQLSTLGGGSYDIATGVYQFTGTAAAAQAAVQGLTFTPTANHVAVGTTETTSFTISVFDGVAPAVTNNATTVVSTSVNEPPTISGIAVAPISINDTGTTSPFQTVVIADPDSTQSQTVTVSFTAANGSLSNLGGGTVVGGVYSFNGTAAAAQAAVRGLVFTPTANQVAVGTAQTTAFTLSVNDGSGAVTDNTTTVLATSVNDAPTVGGVTAVTTITDKVTATPFSHFTINDVDFGPQDQFVTVTLDNAAKGTLSSTLGAPVGTYNAATGVYTLSAIGISAAVAQTEIQSLVFTPAQNRVPVGTTETTTFTVSVNDGVVVTPTTNSATTVVSSSVNDAPVLGGGVAGQTVNDTATLSPFTAFTLTDADNPAQTQTVTVTLDNAAKGALSSSTSVGSYNAATGVYNFTGTASAAQAAIQSLVFTPAANRVAVNATETTTFTVKANDGFVTTTDSTTTVISTSMNDAPVLGGAGVGQTVNDNATLSPFASFTVSDADGNQTQNVTITLDDPTKGTLTNLGSGSFVAGVYSFTGTAAQAQTAIRGLIFHPAANRVAVDTTETTTFAVSVTDSGGLSASNSLTTVVSKSINDAPVLGNAVAGQPVTDTASVSPFATFTISDPDVGQTQTVTVALDDFAKGVLTNLGGGTYNAGTGVYSFTGTAAAAQTAIQGLTFTPTPNHVTVGSTEITTFTVTVNDGAPSSPSVTNSATSVITTSVNDAPVLGGITAVTNVADNTTVGVTPFASVTITDPDSPAQTQTVKVTLDATAKGVLSNLGAGTYDSSTGVYTFKGTATDAQAAIRGLIVTPNANRVAVGATETTTFTITVNDGVAAIVTNNATTVVSSSINDAPTLGGAVPGQTVDDNATLSPFAAFTVTDPDSTQTQTLTVTLDDATKGSLSNLAGGTFVAGTYSFTGTAAQAQTAIRGLIFTPTPNHVAVGSTETTTFTVNVTDSFPASATDATTTVIAKSINDAPVLANITPVTNILDTAVAHPFSTVTISDADAAQSQTVTITLDNAAKGQLSTLGGGSYDIATGVYQFTGTAAAAQAAVQGLTFTPTANHVAVGTTETTSFTISVFDGVAPAVTNNATTVVSTSVNEPPTISGIAVAPISINDTGTTSPFQTVVIADPDSTQSQTVTVSFTAANGSLSNLGGGTVVGGVYSFNGTAAAAQAAVRGLVFTPTANQVAVGTAQTTAFTLSVNDGSGAVTDNTTTVLATSVNDAPTVGGVTAVTTITDKVTATPFSHFTINDVDFGPQDQFVTVTLDNAAKGTLSSTLGAPVGTYNAATGVYTLSAIGISAAVAQTEIQSLVFTPAQNRVPVGTTETTTFTVSVNDGVVVTPTTNSATTVVSSSVNDAPVLGGGVAGQTVNDTATLSPFTAFTLTDADNPAQTQTVTVTLDNAAKGSFTNLSGGSFAAGVYTFTGTAVQAQAALRNLIFVPAANRVAVNATETTTFTVKAFDGFATTSNSTTTVISTSMNDAPVLGGAGVGQTVNDNATLSPFTNFTVSDPDVSQIQNVTITLDDPTKGTLTNLGSGSFVAGVYSFTGTAAQAQTAIRGLIFHPAANRVAVDTTETTTFAVSVTDSALATTTNSQTTVISKSINDVPVLGAAISSQPVNDNATISPFTSFIISDPDVGQQQTVTVALDSFAKGVLTNLGGGNYDATTGVYSFIGTAAAAQTAIRGLLFTPTANRVATGTTETTTFTVSVNDGAPSSPTVSNSVTTVISKSVNDAPVLGGITPVTAVNDDTTVGVTPFASVTITDPDSPAQTQAVKVQLDTAAKGVLSNLGGGAYNSVTGIYTFSGTAAQAEVAIHGLVFTPNANRVAVGTTETTTFTLSVNDGVAAIVTNNATTVVSTSINDAPILGGAVSGQTVNDNATLSPFAAFTVTDPDVAQSQTLTISLSDPAKGVLSNLGTGTYDPLTGIYTFTGTAAQAQSVIRGLIFTPANNHIAVGTTETTTFSVSISDSVAPIVTDNTTTVTAKSINDAPVVTGALPNQAVNDNTTISPFAALNITDADNTQIQTVTVKLDVAAKGAFSNLGTGTYDVVTGVYSFSGTAVDAQAAVRALIFTPTANRVAVGGTESTTFTVSVNDGVAPVVNNTATTVISTSMNDKPVLSGALAGQSITDDSHISPFSTFTVTDSDSTQIQTVTVSFAATNGALSNLGGGAFNAGTGVYSFSGTAAQAQIAIRGLIFTPVANRVAVGSIETTTFTVSVNDGSGAVTDSNTSVDSTSVNDAPVIAGISAVTNITDKATATPFSTITISDLDVGPQTETVSITLDTAAKGIFTPASLGGGTYNPVTGVYDFTGTAAAAQTAIRGLVFSPTENQVTPTTTETTKFTISVSDGVVATPVINSSTTVVSTSVNDAPTLAGATPSTAITDIQTATPFSTFTIADVDNPAQTQTLKVTLDSAAKGTLSNLGGGAYNATTGVYTFTGTAAQAQTAIQNLVFIPTANHVALGITDITTFTVSVNDGITTVQDATTTVTTTSVNDAPVIGGALSGQTVNDNATLSPFGSFTVSDPDIGQIQTVSITLSDFNNGTLTNLGSGGAYNAATGVYSFTGTAAAAQTAIRGLIFHPTANQAAVDAITTTNFLVSVTDSGGLSASDSLTSVLAKSINDAPVLGGAISSQAVTDKTTISPFASFTITDPDPGQIETLTVTLDNAAKGALSNLGTGAYNAATGIYSFTGTAAAAQSAVQGLLFTPNENRVAVGTAETTTFTVNVSDGVAPAVSNGATTVLSTSINDSPVLGGALAAQTVNDNASLSPFSTFTITDVDTPAQTQTVTVTLDLAAKGKLSNVGTGNYNAATGVYSFSGTAAAAQAAIHNLVFTPTANRVPVGSAETTTFTVSVNDGDPAAPVINSATTVLSTSMNDAPTLATPTTISYIDTKFLDDFTTNPSNHGTLVGSDVEPGTIFTYGITGGTVVGNTVTATNAYGILTVDTVSGAYSFAPDNAAINQLGTAATGIFTVTVSDGSLNASKTLTVAIAQSEITETNGADVLTGISANEIFNGFNGNDQINGGLGSDSIDGGAGNDILDGGFSSSPTVAGTLDTLNGEADNDTFMVRGYWGAGKYDGGLGTDLIDFSQPDATILTSRTTTNSGVKVDLSAATAIAYTSYFQPTNTFFANAQAQIQLVGIENITGTVAGDLIIGDSNDNIINGGANNSTATISGVLDVLQGGLGNDTFQVTSYYARGAYDGGLGTSDWLDFSQSDTSTQASRTSTNSGVKVDLAGSVAHTSYSLATDTFWTGALGQISLNNIENVRGTSVSDTLIGDANGNVLEGGNGIDLLIGGGGKDTYNLVETVSATDLVRIATGQSLVSNFDVANNFKLGAGAVSTTGIDALDLPNSLIAANAVVNGTDIGTIASHSITSGIISFGNADAFVAPPVTISSATNLADVLGYLEANITGGNTVAFVADGNTYVFQDNGVGANADTLVELVGVTATSIDNVSANGIANNAVWIL